MKTDAVLTSGRQHRGREAEQRGFAEQTDFLKVRNTSKRRS